MLDLSSGKNALYVFQIVGPNSVVIVVDHNFEILTLSCSAVPVVIRNIGHDKCSTFPKRIIEVCDVLQSNGNSLLAPTYTIRCGS